MNSSRRQLLLRLFGLLNVLFPLTLGGVGVYAVEEARYRDVAAQAAETPTAAGGPVAPGVAAAQQMLAEVMDDLNQESYYRPLDPADLWYGAVTGMAKATGDQFTTYLPPAANKLFEQDLAGQVEGIGLFVTTSTGELTVVEPVPGSPAQSAGLRRHDKIKQINGYETTGLNTNDATARIRGPAGTVVRLTIQRGTDPTFDVDITRAQIAVPACTSQVRPDGIAVIRCWLFDDKTMTDFAAGLRQAIAANARALIIDLRSNSGGYTQAAQEMLGRLVPPSTGPAYYRAYFKGDFNPEAVPILAPAADAPRWYQKPVVVIQNGDTASASEIVAAALQVYKRATLIGTHSYGKGSEQHYYKLEDGSGLFVTYVHWLTPSKQDINRIPYVAPDPAVTPTPLPTFTPPPPAGVPTLPPALLALHSYYGVLPDIAILSTPADGVAGRDPEMDRAVQYLLTGK